MKKYYIILSIYLFTAIISIGIIYSLIPSVFTYLLIPSIIVPPIISCFFYRCLYRTKKVKQTNIQLCFYGTALVASVTAAAFLGIYYEYPHINFLNVLFFCIVSANVYIVFVALPMYLVSLFYK